MPKAIKNPAFEIGGVTIPPGQRASVEFEVAKLYTHSPLSVTAEVLHGKKPGPVLMINAAIHGDELNGVEVVRQVLERINPATLKGTIIAILTDADAVPPGTILWNTMVSGV